MRSLLFIFPLLSLAACGDKEASDDTGSDDTGSGDTGGGGGDGGGGTVDADGDGFDSDEDCNDSDPDVFPGADELCNGMDDDCDLETDEDALDMHMLYGDLDGDGYGDPADALETCENTLVGYVDNSDDCDDQNGASSPGLSEIDCDWIDNDCDGVVDHGLSVPGTWSSVQLALDGASDGDEVCVQAGVWSELLSLSDARDITLVGEGQGITVLEASSRSRHVLVSNGATLTLREMSVQGGAGGTGGAFQVSSADLVLRDVEITDLACPSSGACLGIVAYSGDANLDFGGVWIHDISATSSSYMGGLFDTSSGGTQWDLRDIEVSGVRLTGGGNGIYGGLLPYAHVGGSHIELSDALIYGNQLQGGIVWPAMGWPLSLGWTDVSIFDNEITAGTSAMLAGVGVNDGTMDRVEIVGNTLVGDSSIYGVLANGSELVVTNGLFSGNQLGDSSSKYVHGILAQSYGSLRLVNADVAANSATGTAAYTAGVYCGNGACTLNNVNFIGNQITSGLSAHGSALMKYSGTSFAASYLNVMGNAGSTPMRDDTAGAVSTAGQMTVDPLYMDIASSDPVDWDLHLDIASPVRNMGDPAILNDDSTTSDIGAYGGPNGAW